MILKNGDIKVFRVFISNFGDIDILLIILWWYDN